MLLDLNPKLEYNLLVEMTFHLICRGGMTFSQLNMPIILGLDQIRSSGTESHEMKLFFIYPINR